jgi:hypothetical protein
MSSCIPLLELKVMLFLQLTFQIQIYSSSDVHDQLSFLHFSAAVVL